MKKYLLYIGLLVFAFFVPSCKDYLTELEPGVSTLNDYFTSGDAALSCVNACYVPLMWEYNKTYCSEWFIGDIASDDALKGGQSTSDMAAAYDIENWKTNASNQLLLDIYQANYQGIGRCNLALKYIEPMALDTMMTQRVKNRILGEAHFLRAYYYFRLLRIFGGVPLTTDVIDSEDKWIMERASQESIWNQIIQDLEYANAHLWRVSEMTDDDRGRATKGAAQAMLMKSYLYMAGPYWGKALSGSSNAYYVKAKAWGDSIIISNDYSLCPTYWDNFTLAGENGPESVFEIQYHNVEWGDYGPGDDPVHFGYTAGSFTQILVRSRSSILAGGWGFNHPTQNLWDEFEPSDTLRRSAAILVPTDAEIEKPSEEIYLGSRYLNNKYGFYGNKLDHQSRGPLNNKQIRYADVLLMYAEACLYTHDESTAKTYINKVRQRVGLPTIDENYSITINGQEVKNPTTEQLLRHERRMELAMEGHRWFDLVRWGNTKAHMEAYEATESAEARSHISLFVEGKHEIFPIPVTEIELCPSLEQNYGY